MDIRKDGLHPLLRLAVVSGVETAVKIHIRRGDDLDARDGNGATPLILAATRKKPEILRLLLEAGANPFLLDPNGMDARAHAVAAGRSDAVALLTDAMTRLSVPEQCESGALNPSSAVTEHINDDCREVIDGESHSPSPRPPLSDSWEEPVSRSIPSIGSEAFDCARPVDTASLAPAPVILSFEDIPSGDVLEMDWEAEGEPVIPAGDDSIAEVAKRVREAIGRHKTVDRDEGWDDFDLYLPLRAAPLAREDGDGPVRDILLAALREGMVAAVDLMAVCSDADGTRNEEAERLLTIVIGELGASVVEWAVQDGLADVGNEPSANEERLLDEAIEFAGELASGGNDPFRHYSKSLRGRLLDASEEIFLSREMEECGRMALSALARCPEGLAAVFEAADRVARGEADPAGYSEAGPDPYSHGEQSNRKELLDDEDEGEELDDTANYFMSAVDAVKVVQHDVPRLTDALEATRLTRAFLFELAERVEPGPAGLEFKEALKRQAAARDCMISSNLRLALSIAKKFIWSGVPLDDLVQEANIGLMKAVERFDWRRGFRFSTYATWWIRQQVSRSVADTSRVVRAPAHLHERARKVQRELEEVEARLGRPERASETAARIGVSLAKTRVLLSLFDEPVSLDDIDPDTGQPGVQTLPATQTPDPSEIVEHAALRTALFRMLDDLDARGRAVILLRFGLAGGDPMTLEEVGQHFGLTRERIRQIESKSIRRLSHPSRRAILWPFMGDDHAPDSHVSGVAAIPPAVSSEGQGPERKTLQSAASPAIVAPPRSREQSHPASSPSRSVQPVGDSDLPEPTQAVGMLAIPASGLDSEAPHCSPVPDVSTDSPSGRFSRLGHEARSLGLTVFDRSSEGGQIRIVAPYDSPPAIRAFGRRLLAAGFRKLGKDVFVK